MATFSYTPSYSTSVDYAPKIKKATFGDGYVQAARDGINPNPKKWSLTFNGVDLTTATNIIAFFKTNTTDVTSFDWTDPDGDALKYKCEMYRRAFDGAGSATISCTFEQVFW